MFTYFCVFVYVWEGICMCVLLNLWYVYATSHVENMWTHTLLSGYICSAQPAFFQVSECTWVCEQMYIYSFTKCLLSSWDLLNSILDIKMFSERLVWMCSFAYGQLRLGCWSQVWVTLSVWSYFLDTWTYAWGCVFDVCAYVRELGNAYNLMYTVCACMIVSLHMSECIRTCKVMCM